MKIIDAFSGRSVHVGDELPVPGDKSTYRVVEISPNALIRGINSFAYALFGWGLVAPKIRVESADSHLNDQWIPLIVRRDHPSYPGQIVAFIPS